VERAAALAVQKYHDPAWHAGSWMELTSPEVRALLPPARSAGSAGSASL
jgi:hypothetical protein